MKYNVPSRFCDTIQLKTNYLRDLRKEQIILDEYFEQNIKSKLDDSTLDVFKKYTSDYYSSVVSYLIKKNRINAQLEHDIELISNAIKLYRIPKPLTVYRGTSVENFNYMNEVKDNSFKSRTFVSTSIDINETDSFKYDLLMSIDIPKDYPALWVDPLSSMGEKEILLPVGTQFDIVSQYTDDDEDIDVINAKVKTM